MDDELNELLYGDIAESYGDIDNYEGGHDEDFFVSEPPSSVSVKDVVAASNIDDAAAARPTSRSGFLEASRGAARDDDPFKYSVARGDEGRKSRRPLLLAVVVVVAVAAIALAATRAMGGAEPSGSEGTGGTLTPETSEHPTVKTVDVGVATIDVPERWPVIDASNESRFVKGYYLYPAFGGLLYFYHDGTLLTNSVTQEDLEVLLGSEDGRTIIRESVILPLIDGMEKTGQTKIDRESIVSAWNRQCARYRFGITFEEDYKGFTDVCLTKSGAVFTTFTIPNEEFEGQEELLLSVLSTVELSEVDTPTFESDGGLPSLASLVEGGSLESHAFHGLEFDTPSDWVVYTDTDKTLRVALPDQGASIEVVYDDSAAMDTLLAGADDVDEDFALKFLMSSLLESMGSSVDKATSLHDYGTGLHSLFYRYPYERVDGTTNDEILGVVDMGGELLTVHGYVREGYKESESTHLEESFQSLRIST